LVSDNLEVIAVDEVIRIRIVQTAAELFNTKGYRNVTLSELAERLGMSKKTLYLYFDGKEQIAGAVLENTMTAIAGKITELTQREGDPLGSLRDTFEGIKHELIKLSPLFLEDVQKYIPELWQRIEAFRAGQLSFIEGLLQQAHQAGLIREINPRLVAALMSESIQTFLRPDFAAKHGVTTFDVVETLLVMLIDGIRIPQNH
jgi:AcrR family transcriptional regulator